MTITVEEVMQVPHLDTVRIGQDLCAFHLAIVAYSSETEQNLLNNLSFVCEKEKSEVNNDKK